MNYYPNLSLDYIGATGEHSITDYIDLTSNQLNNKINSISFSNVNSNIDKLRNETYHINSNNPLALVATKTYSGTPHTYIINSNMYGEIRFNTYFSFSATDDPINNYAVKIDNFGKLYVYHKFNLLQPTFPAGWYDIEGEVLGLKNQGLVVDGTLAGLGTFQTVATGQINLLQSLVATLKLQADNLQYQIEMLGFLTENEAFLIQGSQTFEQLVDRMDDLALSMTRSYNNTISAVGSVGVGFGTPLILSAITDFFNRQYYYNLASNFSNAYLPSLTTEQRRILYSCNNIPYLSNTSNYNYYTCNLGLYQGFINSNITNTQFIPNLNTNEIKFNNSSLFTYLPYQSPTATGAFTTTTINANTFAYTFTGTGQLIIPLDTIIDILIVGAGGRGGAGPYAGGGGAGEVVYYPQYAIPAGTYDITIGIDSATTTDRISSIKKAGVNQIRALGGGNGAYWNYEYSIERVYPPKAYNSTTARTATTIMGRSCQKYTMTLNTTGITYGSGTYELYVSTVYSSATQYDGYRMFDYDSASTVNRWAGLSGQYVITTGAVSASSTQYFIDNTYKGDWFVIKLSVPIALTKYDIYQTSSALDRAPKNFKVYGSVSGTSFTLLQTITGATYTSRLYTNTGLSTNTTPYQYYAFAVNNLVGGSTSTLIDIVEFKLYGKEPININSAVNGGSGGGGWYNPNLPAFVKKGYNYTSSIAQQYSFVNAGLDPVDIGTFSGGNGGSAFGTGRFGTTIRGSYIYVGQGGTATQATPTAPTATTNYGDGGNAGTTQGGANQGICIIRFSTNFITKYNHYLSWDKILNIQVGEGLFVDGINANKISTSWSKNSVYNWLYNNHGGNVGINVDLGVGILEKLHIGDLGNQKGKLLIGTDYDHVKISHDGYNAYLDIGGADNYFSIRIDYPPDWNGYNSIYYYDIITILNGSGYVGIQNTAPTCALDVNGAINCSGNLTVGGDLNGTSISLSGSMSVPTLSPTYINSCSSASITTVNSTTLNATTFNGLVNFTNGNWNTSADGKYRMYFAANSHSYWGTYGNHVFRNALDSDIATFDSVGNLTCGFECFSVTNTDHLGIYINFPTVGSTATKRIYALFNTFTGYHRCFIEDEKFDINDWENFRKEYEGRVVVSTGKIKTHIKDGEEIKEWTAFCGKEGITIEDALPIIELSRKKKDKRIYGVLGSHNRPNSANDRMIINGCGEGAIWVVNSNGNIENGDLLQTSDHLGYAERQDDDLIRNYTVGKVVMDCTFELDSPEYRCEVIEGGLRRAFLACVYMSA